jgi:tetratricopeptide (TPR) repeat protein
MVPSLCQCLEQLGRIKEAEGLARQWLATAKASADADPINYARALAALGWNLVQQKQYIDAEPILRECLGLREKNLPEAWQTFNTRWMLGGALLGQKKLAEAEPLLVKGYEGMRQREATIPPKSKIYVNKALERLVEFYDAVGKKNEADKLRKELVPDKASGKADRK